MKESYGRKTGSGKIKPIGRLWLTFVLLAVVLTGFGAGTAAAAEKTFVFNIRAARDIETFRAYAELASRMKKYGNVQIAISGLADKSWFQMPEYNSPWHEYCNYMSAPWMYYPHPLIAPHVPSEWVAANVKLLQSKRAVINELGLEGIFAGKNSEMLPESFFAANPRLRGPRVDHPRRSTREEFSWCVDLEETREIIKWTMSELLKHAPEIKVFSSGTNDAGSGLCWAEAQYPGSNGPRHCMHRGVGVRTHDLVEAVLEGARMGGGDILFRWDNVNFWRNEDQIVRAHLPENAMMTRGDRTGMGVGTQLNNAWPFMGLIDPLSIISGMERYRNPRIKFVSIGTSAMYDRHEDSPETVSKVLDLMEECIAEPTDGMMEQLEKLRKVARMWGGEQNEEQVFSALYDIHQALQLKGLLSARYSHYYCGVSMRHLTRPLVIKPELLTPEEEAYFLPYVFNPDENEGRMDWIDLHGGRMTGTVSWNDRHVSRILSLASSAGRRLNDVQGAPEHDFLHNLSLSVRMWASELRSIHNFYHAQLIRDDNAEILAGEPRVMEKKGNWDGEPGNLEWNEIMRDEFDNANELIALLEDGGIKLVAAAKTPEYEDTFLIGPDLIGELRMKVKIMREHWLDAQDYIASPHK